MNDLLVQGVELLVLGMGIVFGFLIVLVFMLRAMSLLAARLDDTPAGSVTAEAITVADDRQLIAVIGAAVARYRASRAN